MATTLEQFPNIPSSPASETGDWRAFKGNGTAFLPVANLTKVNAVKCGLCVIPLEITESYPTDLAENLTKQEEFTIPLIKLDKLDDGTIVLIRSVKSNDGVWQDGADVYVDGEWSDKAKK